jgi:methylase of polypeptide subunit release factors
MDRNAEDARNALTEKVSLTERTFAIAQQCEEIREKYKFHVQGRDFVGYPGVLSPSLSPSTAIWRELPITASEVFLEIGCGTGVFSVLAALAGALKVTSVDINPEAVRNTIENATIHGVEDKLEAYVSDIFGCVPRAPHYTTILWHIPWSHTEKKNLSLIERATFDPGCTLLKRFLAEAFPYLAANGRLLLGYSSTYGSIETYERLCHEYGWHSELLYRVGDSQSFFAELFQLTPVRPVCGDDDSGCDEGP